MSIFRRNAKGEPPPAPVTIDLGLQLEFEVQVVMAALEHDGIRAFLIAQDERANTGGLQPRHCRVLVAPQDEALVRQHFIDGGIL